MISFCKMKFTFFKRSEKLAKHTLGQMRVRVVRPDSSLERSHLGLQLGISPNTLVFYLSISHY